MHYSSIVNYKNRRRKFDQNRDYASFNVSDGFIYAKGQNLSFFIVSYMPFKASANIL